MLWLCGRQKTDCPVIPSALLITMAAKLLIAGCSLLSLGAAFTPSPQELGTISILSVDNLSRTPLPSKTFTCKRLTPISE
jgi:hypothetical protein